VVSFVAGEDKANTSRRSTDCNLLSVPPCRGNFGAAPPQHLEYPKACGRVHVVLVSKAVGYPVFGPWRTRATL
jgi:hypothetical protein